MPLIHRTDLVASTIQAPRPVRPVVEDKIEPYFVIPDLHLEEYPLVYKRGQIPSGVAQRGNKLYVDDLVAVLGPTETDPFWILKIRAIRTKTLDFQWYEKDSKGRYSLLPETHKRTHLFSTYLHWRFTLKADNTMRVSTITSINFHKHSWATSEERGTKRKRND